MVQPVGRRAMRGTRPQAARERLARRALTSRRLRRRSGVRSKAAPVAGVQGARFCLAPPVPVWHPLGAAGRRRSRSQPTSFRRVSSLSAPLERGPGVRGGAPGCSLRSLTSAFRNCRCPLPHCRCLITGGGGAPGGVRRRTDMPAAAGVQHVVDTIAEATRLGTDAALRAGGALMPPQVHLLVEHRTSPTSATCRVGRSTAATTSSRPWA